MGRGKCRDAYLEHETKHRELGHLTTLTDVPKLKEFIVRTDFADADATATAAAAEDDESLDKDSTISASQADDSPGTRNFHWVSEILAAFPLSRAVFAIDMMKGQQRSLLERNQKLLGGDLGVQLCTYSQ